MDTVMKTFSVWISAMRLRTLPLSVSGIILASSFAAKNGGFNGYIFTIAMLTTISLQILSNLANDYGDGVKGTDNNDRIGPERAIQSGSISAHAMMKGIKINIFICIALVFLLIFTAFKSEFFLLTIAFFGLGALAVVAAIKYTIGSNAYGYKGLGDIFVFIFFGLVSVVGCYVLYIKTIDFVVFLPAITIGLLSAAVLNLNNMRDIDSDSASGKITVPVKLGLEKAKYYHNILIYGAILISALFGILFYTSAVNLIYFMAYIPLILHLRKIKHISNQKDFDPELKKIALSTFLLSVLMAVGHIL